VNCHKETVIKQRSQFYCECIET